MEMIPDQDKEFLRGRFVEELESPVTILAFTRKASGQEAAGLECEFCEETQQIVDELAELSGKIAVETHEYSADDPSAREYGVDKLPALVLNRTQGGGVKYYGIPGGFEFSSLIEDLIDVSRDVTNLSREAKQKIREIRRDVHIQVFVTPTCPYCPSAVRTAHQMAIENPAHIRADAVEASEFPHLVRKYDVSAVPTVVINDRVQFEGTLPDHEFAERVAQSVA